MGTPNREPQECSRNVIEHKDPGRCMPIIFLHPWGPCLGFPLKSLYLVNEAAAYISFSQVVSVLVLDT